MKYCFVSIVAVAVVLFSSIVSAENLSGPRIGMTYLSSETVSYANDKDIELSSVISQFGWQFERAFFTTNGGPQGITALIPLLGGADQGLLLPSLSWVTGMRSPSGYEFVVGPNLSVSGVGFAIALGRTMRAGEVNFPINLSLVTSDKGIRFSLLFGFNSVN